MKLFKWYCSSGCSNHAIGCNRQSIATWNLLKCVLVFFEVLFQNVPSYYKLKMTTRKEKQLLYRQLSYTVGYLFNFLPSVKAARQLSAGEAKALLDKQISTARLVLSDIFSTESPLLLPFNFSTEHNEKKSY